MKMLNELQDGMKTKVHDIVDDADPPESENHLASEN
jgi:hypothetical protein